jgi:hypothetical protein
MTCFMAIVSCNLSPADVCTCAGKYGHRFCRDDGKENKIVLSLLIDRRLGVWYKLPKLQP